MIKESLKKRILTSVVLFILIFFIYSFEEILVFCLIVLGVLAILEFLNITKKVFKNKFSLLFLNSFFLIYISIFCFTFFLLSNILQLKIILFSLLISCAASDVGGFIFGKILKGPKLTKISPNKTYSGALGSIILTSLVLLSLNFYLTEKFNFILLIVAIITSIACQLGDLFFSYLKRKAKIKDTGNFFPGHGGVLDRLDGIFFGIPAGLISLTLFY
jgi:phosphatidate cytidylyltransferase